MAGWARRDLRARYRQSAFAAAWTLLQPVSVIAVYALVFSQILGVDSVDLPYLSFVVAGTVAWRMVSIGFNQAMCFVDQATLMSKVYFRREIVPLSACLAGLLDLAIGTVILVVVAWVQGLPPRFTLVALPLVYLPLILYTGAIAVLVATVSVFVRDVGHAMPTAMQLVFLSAPVMYELDRVPDSLAFLRGAPLAVLIESVRDVSLRGQWPRPGVIAINVVASGVLLALAVRYLRAIEHRIVDVG